jgi:hypothetical protein
MNVNAVLNPPGSLLLVRTNPVPSRSEDVVRQVLQAVEKGKR